jgi:hypothetical protein
MTSDQLVPALALFTLIAGVAIAAIALARFLRRPGNQHPLDTPQGKANEARWPERRRAEDQARKDLDPPR